jgi:hypothetical protein
MNLNEERAGGRHLLSCQNGNPEYASGRNVNANLIER